MAQISLLMSFFEASTTFRLNVAGWISDAISDITSHTFGKLAKVFIRRKMNHTGKPSNNTFIFYSFYSFYSRQLLMWLWPPLIQCELDNFRHYSNNRQMRKQPEKLFPSGVSPHFAYSCPEEFGARECLQTVNLQVVNDILRELEDEKRMLSDWGIPPEFAERAKAALDMAGVDSITLSNVWVVFNAILRFL